MTMSNIKKPIKQSSTTNHNNQIQDHNDNGNKQQSWTSQTPINKPTTSTTLQSRRASDKWRNNRKKIDRIAGVRRNCKKKTRFIIKPKQFPPLNIECESREATIMASTAINSVQSHSLKQGKEVKQLHDRSCFCPIHFDTLTKLERQRTSRSLTFVTEKRDGTKVIIVVW